MDAEEAANPKKALARREREAGLNVGEVGKPWDKTFDSGAMSQTQFSKYSANKSKLPPPELMKKHIDKE